MNKKCLSLFLAGQLAISSIGLATPTQDQRQHRQSQKSVPLNPIDTGHFFISDLKESDINMLLDLSRGDFFGISQQKLQDYTKSPYYRVDSIFGPYLLTPPPAAKTFIDSATFNIGADGELVVTEPNDKPKNLLGRSHTFSNWKVKNVFPTTEYVFLEVESGFLDPGRTMNKEGVSSLVAIRTTDLTQYLGARRILSTVIPLPFQMKDIDSIEYFDINSPKAKVHSGISKIISSEYKTGGYVLKDSQGREQFLPDVIPDLYSDMTRVLIRGIGATLSHNLALHESVNPVLKRHIKGLVKFIENSNIRLNGAYQKIIDQSLKQLTDAELAEVSMREGHAFSRRSLVTDLSAPRSGNFVTQLFGDNKFTPEQIASADSAYQKNVQSEFEAYENQEIKKLQNQMQEKLKPVEQEARAPYPTPEEMNVVQSALDKIKNLKGQSLQKVQATLQGPLGNVALLLFGISTTYLFVEYTAIGTWASDYAKGYASLNDFEIILHGIRATAIATLALGGILTAGFMLNKWVNKVTGKNQDFFMAIASLTRKFPVFWDGLSRGKKLAYKFAFPFYADAIFAGALPTKENGGKYTRWALLSFKVSEFSKALFKRSNPDLPLEAIKSSQLLKQMAPPEPIDEKRDMALEPSAQRLEKGLSLKRAWQQMKSQSLALKAEMNTQQKTEGDQWRQVKSWVNSQALPDFAKAHGLSTLEFINKLAYAPGLFENEQFFELNERDIESLMRSGKVAELNKIERESRNIKDQAEFYKEQILSLYFSEKEKAKLIDKIKNSPEFVDSIQQLKAIYYLTMAEAHKDSRPAASKAEIQEAYARSKARIESMKHVDEQTRLAIRQEVKKSVLFYQSTYRAIREFQKEGLAIKLYTGLSNVSPANVEYALKHEIPMDFLLERGMSYAEFYRFTQEMGVSFWAKNMGELFDANHLFGLYRPDAVSAFNNPINNVFMSPLSQANFGGRSGPDAVDKASIGTSIGYAAARQFLNPRRLREMQLLSPSFVFEVSRDLFRRFRSSSMQKFFIFMLIFGSFKPDMIITGYAIYWPMLKIGSFLNSKLMYATNTINYNKQEMIKILESRYLDRKGLRERFDALAESHHLKEQAEKEFIEALGLNIKAGDKKLGFDKLAAYGPVYLAQIEQEYLKEQGLSKPEELTEKQLKALKKKFAKAQKTFNKLTLKATDRMVTLVLGDMLLQEKENISVQFLNEANVSTESQLDDSKKAELDKLRNKIQSQYDKYQTGLKQEKLRTVVNPKTVYALNFLIILNVVYFFSERLGFEKGIVYEASLKVAELFGRPDLAFQLEDIQRYAIEHPLTSMAAISTSLAALYGQKKLSQYRERRALARSLEKGSKAGFSAPLCSQLFRTATP